MAVRNHGYGDVRHAEAPPNPHKVGSQPPAEMLLHLEQRMDPLIARQFHNRNYSRIHQLPNEILFNILTYLYYDDVSFFMVRLVSRRFRFLINARCFQDHQFSSFHNRCEECDGSDPNCRHANRRGFRCPSPRTAAYESLSSKIIPLLQKDELCSRCMASSQVQRNKHPGLSCRFYQPHDNLLHCSGCKAHHPSALFAADESTRPSTDRTCLGRRGNVRLCEHEYITWADVEKCLNYLKGLEDAGNISRTIKVCYHESHAVGGCRKVGVGPEAQLHYTMTGSFCIKIRWEAHSGRRSFPSYGFQGFRASELRQMFHRHRSNAANWIIPQLTPNHLPEMACFWQTGCICVDYYKAQELVDARLRPTTDACTVDEDWVDEDAAAEEHISLCRDKEGTHHSLREGSIRKADISVRVCSQRACRRHDTSPCLVTEYSRLITGIGKYLKQSHVRPTTGVMRWIELLMNGLGVRVERRIAEIPVVAILTCQV